jgi:hypothetical protein
LDDADREGGHFEEAIRYQLSAIRSKDGWRVAPADRRARRRLP